MVDQKGYQYQLLLDHFGELPSGWSVVPLSEIFDERAQPNADLDTHPLYSFTIENGVTPKTERYERSFLLKDREENEYKLVYPNDFVINPMNLRFGAIGYSKLKQAVSVSAYYNILKVKSLTFDIDFLETFLSSKGMLNIYNRVAIGSLIEKRRVHYSEFRNLKIFSPPQEEQARLGDIIRTWNARIQGTERLIAAKAKRKRGLMQQLLTGKKRFREFANQKWQQMKISSFAGYKPRIKEKPEKAFTALGIRSHGKGTFLKPDFDPAKIEMDELFQVKENDLIVNITFAWEGAIAIAGASDDGALVSHRFPTYEFKTDVAIPEFFRHVIIQKWFINRLGIISPGGAGRNRVLSKRDFGNLQVLLPSVEEQQRIATVLDACDKEIALLIRQLDTLKRQKRGLMQKLLTGRIRTRVEHEDKEELVSA